MAALDVENVLSLNLWATIGFTHIGASADDFFLLRPSVSHLQKLLDIFVVNCKIKFN